MLSGELLLTLIFSLTVNPIQVVGMERSLSGLPSKTAQVYDALILPILVIQLVVLNITPVLFLDANLASWTVYYPILLVTVATLALFITDITRAVWVVSISLTIILFLRLFVVGVVDSVTLIIYLVTILSFISLLIPMLVPSSTQGLVTMSRSKKKVGY